MLYYISGLNYEETNFRLPCRARIALNFGINEVKKSWKISIYHTTVKCLEKDYTIYDGL